MDHVLVINFHGGFPSCMIKKAFKQLPHLSALAQISDLHSRVYPSNASAGPSLHDIIMDAPLASMTDSVWHNWCHIRRASRTLFHIFQQHDYTTRLFGAFGLEKKLDPHSTMYAYPGESRKALQLYGIDEFETQDAAFTCQMAFAHDRNVMDNVCRFLENVDGASFTMVNLLGCQDIHKCRFDNVSEEDVAVPLISLDDFAEQELFAKLEDFDPRQFADSIMHDNPRCSDSEASKFAGLQRAVLLYDWLRGEQKTSTDATLRTVHQLHKFAWKCLSEFDKSLGRLVHILRQRNLFQKTSIYITSDHPMSLYEHGEICEAPWDACLRSFLLVHHPQQVNGRELTQPYSLAHLSTRIMNDCNLYADWHVQVKESTALTLGMCPSWLCRAFVNPRINVFEFETFFIRCVLCRHGRLYAITCWFSLMDMLKANDAAIAGLTYSELATLCHRTHEWKNPILNKDLSELTVQIYDLTTDPCEITNIANHVWLASKIASSLKRDVDDAIREFRFEDMVVRFPENVDHMTPDKITFCSVQLHHRVRDRVRECKSVSRVSTSTQTEETTLRNALLSKIDAALVTLLLPHMQPMDSPMTVFIPDHPIRHLPEWLPVPTKGILTFENLRHFAQESVALPSAKQVLEFKLLNAEVTVNQCRISNAVETLHFQTFTIFVYTVSPPVMADRSNQPSIVTTAPTISPNTRPFAKASPLHDVAPDVTVTPAVHPKSRNPERTLHRIRSTQKKADPRTELKGKAKHMEISRLQKEAHR